MTEQAPNTEQTTISVQCPHCQERFVVVREEEASEQTHNQQNPPEERDEPMNSELLSYEVIDGGQPYSGRDEEIPVEECVRAKITIDGKTHQFTFWYTPDRDGYKYIVRGDFDSGSKMKTVYSGDGSPFFTPRGVPKNSDKQWTYLDEEECRRRAKIAGLGEVQPPSESSDRCRILIGESKEGLVENGELLLKLAKGVAAFQTTEY